VASRFQLQVSRFQYYQRPVRGRSTQPMSSGLVVSNPSTPEPQQPQEPQPQQPQGHQPRATTPTTAATSAATSPGPSLSSPRCLVVFGGLQLQGTRFQHALAGGSKDQEAAAGVLCSTHSSEPASALYPGNPLPELDGMRLKVKTLLEYLRYDKAGKLALIHPSWHPLLATQFGYPC
jgi:hypothetical protein